MTVPTSNNGQSQSAPTESQEASQRYLESSRDQSIDTNVYGPISGGVLEIEGIVLDGHFEVESNGNPTHLYRPIHTQLGREIYQTVYLDAPLEPGRLSSQTFPCLLLGKQRGSLGSFCYLILEATGNEPKQYRRLGLVRVDGEDYDNLLHTTERDTIISIV